MAKKVLADEINAMVAAGATKVENNLFLDANGNPLQIRNMESTNDPLEIGDVITVPTDYTVLTEKLNDNPISFLVEEVSAEDGSERNMRFFPNSLAKNIYPIDENRRRMAKVKTGGSVAKWFAEQAAAGKDINAALKELAGKKFKVTAKTAYTRFKFGSTTETETTNIYAYDWA